MSVRLLVTDHTRRLARPAEVVALELMGHGDAARHPRARDWRKAQSIGARTAAAKLRRRLERRWWSGADDGGNNDETTHPL